MNLAPGISQAQAKELIVASVRDNYKANPMSDEEALNCIKLAAEMAELAGVSATEYLRLAMRGLKEAGARQLADRVHDEIYMPLIMEAE